MDLQLVQYFVFILGLLSGPEDADSEALRHLSKIMPGYTASYPRRKSLTVLVQHENEIISSSGIDNSIHETRAMQT
jgi:hypothetical protein